MDLRSFSINMKNGEINSLDPQENRQYYYIRQDDQIDPKYYSRAGLNRPMVFRLETYRTMPFNKKMQVYCRDLNKTGDDEYDKRTFADKWDTWVTNERRIREIEGRPGHANYITGELLDREDPSWATLVCGRNALCGEEVVSDGSFGILNGVKCLRVYTLNPDNLPVGMTYKTNPEFIHHCTIINSATNKDEYFDKFLYKSNPFPQNGGRGIFPFKPTYYPLMSYYPVYIPMWMLIKLPLGSKIPNPYNPEWTDWK
jgi:hypothetical protein